MPETDFIKQLVSSWSFHASFTTAMHPELLKIADGEGNVLSNVNCSLLISISLTFMLFSFSSRQILCISLPNFTKLFENLSDVKNVFYHSSLMR